MHILLCHERFLPRFGVDRLLLRCAAEFRQQGHRVTLVGAKFSEEPEANLADAVIRIPTAEPYINLDLNTSAWLAEEWNNLFGQHPPDLAVSAGWPFFSALGVFADRRVRTVFCECGITPTEGLPEGARRTLNLLAGLKAAYLPLADAIAPISDFLLESQVRALAPSRQMVRTIRLSGAHVLERSADAPATPGDQTVPPDVIALGRFEPGNYKQSELITPLVRELADQFPAIRVGVLATDEEISSLPGDVRPLVVPLGHPNDAELERLTRGACCAVVFSRWEGFNLPLAEAATLGVHCLVFNVGAHPEVVPHPWYLCTDLAEMVAKATALLAKTAPQEIIDRTALAAYVNRRPWRQVTGEYLALLEEINRSTPGAREPRKLSLRRNDLWVIDVTNASHDPANSGVIRVCRRLSAELQRLVPALFVVWDPALGTYRFPYAAECDLLATFGGPQCASDHPRSPPGQPLLLSHYLSPHNAVNGWLILPEIRHDPDFALIRSQAKAWGLRISVVFHDAIPLLRPDLVADPVYRDGHHAYMGGLSECHIVLPNSKSSSRHLEDFWRKEGFGDARGTVCTLPGSSTNDRPASTGSTRKAILCVSTLEPRKGHARLLEAFLSVPVEERGDWELILVGNRYAGAPELAAHVEATTRSHPSIRWLGIVPDDELMQLYQECAFTVFASEIEGFGLPILESIWHGRPCLCHDAGVMAELASGGGCLTADLTNPQAFSGALRQLMSSLEMREALRLAAIMRPVKSWGDYSREFLGHLLIVGRVHAYQPIPAAAPSPKWHEYLYKDCLTQNWQMNDSERMALLALLARFKPKVGIEIGTFRGGSLSLIRQHCEIVFSIDIDPKVRADFGWMANVSFLTGYSHEILPSLFNALAASAMSPGLILIDGDHSAEGVRKDIEAVLDFVPTEPCLVLMHDTANAKCRSGQVAARWARSPYVHYVDLDFVPGRLVEHGGGSNGEVWGGLGLAILFPVPRTQALAVCTTAQGMTTQLQKLAAAN